MMKDGYYWVEIEGEKPAVGLVRGKRLVLPGEIQNGLLLTELDDFGIKICEEVKR